MINAFIHTVGLYLGNDIWYIPNKWRSKWLIDLLKWEKVIYEAGKKLYVYYEIKPESFENLDSIRKELNRVYSYSVDNLKTH